MKLKNKNIGIGTQVFIAMLLGGIAGLLIGTPMQKVGFIGDIWLNAIKMIIVPMVLVTIITGITSQEDTKTLGRISIRIMSYYIITTLIASVIGLVVANVIKPGVRANFIGMEAKEITGSLDITVSEFFTGMMSSNMFETFTEGNILQTLIIAVLIGIAILKLKDNDIKKKVISGVNALADVVFSLIGMIMKASPIGVFFLMADSFATYGASIFSSIAVLLGTFYLALILQTFIVYGGVLWLTAKITPLKFLKNSSELWSYTIATCSSVAAIPIGVKVATEKFEAPERIASFTIPLGSQMNYDGSVMLYAVVISFISQMIGQPLTVPVMLRIVLLSAILSTGGGGIPGSGIVKLLVMVEAFGLPTEIVGIVAAFYRLFDMGITTNNCLGDLAGTVFVSELEKKEINNKKVNEQNISTK